MKYTHKHFNPAGKGKTLDDGRICCEFDAGNGKSTYLYDPQLVFAINVALAAKRPLLLAGEPGCGKTTLARNVAQVLGWWYYQHTIGSRTQATDLLWEFDALRRLNDAYDPSRRLRGDWHYIEPGKLWWALAPETAATRGMADADADAGARLKDPGEPGQKNSAVALIDEIDKAEPDVPNDLLEILDTRAFRVKDKLIESSRERALIILTTNGERELPGAFHRRCVVYRFSRLDEPEWYVDIANQWFGAADANIHRSIADSLIETRRNARVAGNRPPGTAEFLDAVRAHRDLDLDTRDAAWRQLVRCVFEKHTTESTPDLTG